MKSQSRVQSASRKNRPESSSPEKLRMRNLHSAKPASTENRPAASEEDDYLEEEIAQDPDENEEADEPASKPAAAAPAP